MRPQDIIRRLVRVDGERENFVENFRLREMRAFCFNPGVGDTGLDQILRIVAIEDGEIPAITEQVGVRSQNPRPDGMERATPKRRQFLSQQIPDPAHHFAGRFVGERQQQDAVGGDALFEQVRDAIGQRAGLARAGAGDDEGRAGRRGNGGQLLGVQLARVINLQMNGRMKRLQNIFARHSSKLKSETREGERKF